MYYLLQIFIIVDLQIKFLVTNLKIMNGIRSTIRSIKLYNKNIMARLGGIMLENTRANVFFVSFFLRYAECVLKQSLINSSQVAFKIVLFPLHCEFTET